VLGVAALGLAGVAWWSTLAGLARKL